MAKLAMQRTAWISPCERYRHSLGRHWDRALGYVLFIGLNPSTANANEDDPTIRRWTGFTCDWGYGGFEVCNLFDWRATDPRRIPRAPFAVSDKSDMMMRRRARKAKKVVACWGAVPWAEWRIQEVFHSVYHWCEAIDGKRWECFGLTKDGFPKHPLYLRKDTKPTLFW